MRKFDRKSKSVTRDVGVMAAVITATSLFLGAANRSVAAEQTPASAEESAPVKVLKETSKIIDFQVDGIPYPVRYAKNEKCNFTEREIRLIQDALIMLPQAYQTMEPDFRIEKKCELNDPSHVAAKDRTRAAYTMPGRVVYFDRTFTVVKDGKLYALNPEFSKKIIAHELTHMLDMKVGLSNQKSFRQINQWKRKWALLLKADPSKAEGFYRDQGEQNPKEDLATSAEGYFFDPNFICQQPAMYAWYSAHIGPTLADRAECAELNAPLDPAKIKAVGYMVISATDSALESRFGHALLHFHLAGNPQDDVLVQAGGNYPGQPVFTGLETPEESKEKQASMIQVSRLSFLFKGATGGLEIAVQPVRYKDKWLETVVLQGRDMQEKILKLTPEQLRAMVYIINRDIQSDLGNYKFFKENCATYVGETLNKVFATDLIHANRAGIYTPKRVYEGVTPVMEQELPLVEGDMTHLKRLMPRRLELIEQLQGDEAFADVSFKAIKKIKAKQKALEAATQTLDQIAAVMQGLSDAGALTKIQRKAVQTLIYTYTFETSLKLKGHALELYKQVAKLPAKDQ